MARWRSHTTMYVHAGMGTNPTSRIPSGTRWARTPPLPIVPDDGVGATSRVPRMHTINALRGPATERNNNQCGALGTPLDEKHVHPVQTRAVNKKTPGTPGVSSHTFRAMRPNDCPSLLVIGIHFTPLSSTPTRERSNPSQTPPLQSCPVHPLPCRRHHHTIPEP